MFKKIYFILITSVSLFAETSVFSTQGPGDLYLSKGTNNGMALSDTLTANPVNYAAWAGISNAYFNLSFDYVNHDVKSRNGAVSGYDDIAISGFSFALPFGENNFFGLNLSPISVVNVQNSISRTEVSSFEPIYYSGVEKRVGSFNNLSMIYGKSIRNISFAFDVSCVFGSINESILQSYGNDEPSSTTSFTTKKIIENNYQTSAFVVNPGISATYRVMDYSFAGKISIPIFNRFEITNSLLKNSYNTDGLVTEEKTLDNCEWPVSFGAGFGWEPEKWQLAGDLFYTAFSDSKLGLAQNENYADYWKLSASAKYHHSDRLLAPYYQKMSYKAGLSIEQRPEKLNDSVINDYTIFGSITTPFPSNRASIETNFSYTLSGDRSIHGFEDKVWKIGFTFNNSNSWWLRKSRYDD